MTDLPVILAGSGLGLLAWQAFQADKAETSGQPAPATPIPKPKPLAGMGMAVPVPSKSKMMANVGQILVVGGSGQTSNPSGNKSPSPLVTGGGGNASDATNAQIQQKLRELEAQAKAEYERLTSQAKKAAADALNKMNPSPGLTGNETFEEAARKVGAAIGSTVGVAACNAIPIPGLSVVAAHTACATLGAIIGAYIGGKLGVWAKNLYADVKAWADRQWDSVKGAAEDVGDAISGAAGDAKDFITDLF